MKRNQLMLAAALTGLLATSGVYAFGGCDGMPPDRGARQGADFKRGAFGPLAGAYRVDNLTADQRKQLDSLRDKARTLREERRAERAALRDAMVSGADAKTLKPLAEKQGQRVTEMIMQQATLHAELDKILTEPQRAQLKGIAQGARGGRWFDR